MARSITIRREKTAPAEITGASNGRTRRRRAAVRTNRDGTARDRCLRGWGNRDRAAGDRRGRDPQTQSRGDRDRLPQGPRGWRSPAVAGRSRLQRAPIPRAPHAREIIAGDKRAPPRATHEWGETGMTTITRSGVGSGPRAGGSRRCGSPGRRDRRGPRRDHLRGCRRPARSGRGGHGHHRHPLPDHVDDQDGGDDGRAPVDGAGQARLRRPGGSATARSSPRSRCSTASTATNPALARARNPSDGQAPPHPHHRARLLVLQPRALVRWEAATGNPNILLGPKRDLQGRRCSSTPERWFEYGINLHRLGRVIDAASGMELDEAVLAHVVTGPLGMNDTPVRDERLSQPRRTPSPVHLQGEDGAWAASRDRPRP